MSKLPNTSAAQRKFVLGLLVGLLACAVIFVPTSQSDAGWRIIPIIDDEYGLMIKVDVGLERILAPLSAYADLQAATGQTPVTMTVHDAVTTYPAAGAGHTICFQNATAAGNVVALLASHGYDVATAATPLPGFSVATRYD